MRRAYVGFGLVLLAGLIPHIVVAAGPTEKLPSVREREAKADTKILIHGFRVAGVRDWSDLGVSPKGMQAIADHEYQRLAAGSANGARVTFEQMQAVADKISQAYKRAGFVVAHAYLPTQTIKADGIVEIDVLEGEIGRIVVKGNKRYSGTVIAAPAQSLRGRPLTKDAVDSALLYMRDLPGTSVSSTFEPGARTGQTDLVLIAHEEPRPFHVTAGANNFGTAFTGRYRAQLGLEANNLLGIGDQFEGSGEYAINPSNNIYGSVTYKLPTVVVPGLQGILGASRNELRINTGQFATLEVKGPSQAYFGGLEWKFINTLDLQVATTFQFQNEQSRLESVGVTLSNERINLASYHLALNHADRRFRGVDLVELGVHQSINDYSSSPDLVSANHARNFLLETLSYTRLQFLTRNQTLYLKLNGQYTNQALIPLEQFSIGGPSSVRAYPIADALADRGYYTAVEYHVNAPGFANKSSPFYGRPWRELLELEVFGDYAKGFAAGANKATTRSVEYSGMGAGVIFRVPRFYHLQFHLQGAHAIGSARASDGNRYHIYGQLSLSY